MIKRIGHILLLNLIFNFGLLSQHHPDILSRCDVLLQERGEIYLKFDAQSDAITKELSRIVSIDHASTALETFAYVNVKNYGAFLNLNISFEIVKDYYRPVDVRMLTIEELLSRSSGECLQSEWDFYPTYEAYVDMMNQFAADNPMICSVHAIGVLSSGKEILALKITNHEDDDQDKPKFFYTSTMHGDETAGFPLLLRLSDYLLCQYDDQQRIADIVDNVEIWINPLANPDGLYFGGNNTVLGAIRGNLNGVDLNGNFPDALLGMHPDGEDFQEETILFMEFAEEHQFNMSANFHSGAEIFNYPFDTWSRLPADDDWWNCLGRAYADTVHLYAPNGYFDLEDNGVSNGFAWFESKGTRQDYTTYFLNGREFTLELTDQKILDKESLPEIWNYHYRSLLNYLEECNNGLRGLITDSQTDEPIEAEVFILNHDVDNSQVYSSAPLGRYYRYLADGLYEIRFSAEGYKSQTISVDIEKGQRQMLDVALVPRDVSADEIFANDLKIWTSNKTLFITNETNTLISFELYDLAGKSVCKMNVAVKDYQKQFANLLDTGIYLVKIKTSKGTIFKKMLF